MIVVRSFLARALYDCFKVIYMYLNEADKVRHYYSCLKMMIEAHLNVGFLQVTFFTLNVQHLHDSVYILSCCNQA